MLILPLRCVYVCHIITDFCFQQYALLEGSRKHPSEQLKSGNYTLFEIFLASQDKEQFPRTYFLFKMSLGSGLVVDIQEEQGSWRAAAVLAAPSRNSRKPALGQGESQDKDLKLTRRAQVVWDHQQKQTNKKKKSSPGWLLKFWIQTQRIKLETHDI